MKEKKITIRDIAEGCGVCIATVSRAINGTAAVKPEVRERIFQYMEDIGWRSNNLKSRLVLPDAARMAVLLTNREEPHSERNITIRLSDRLWEAGMLPMMFAGGSAKALEFCLESKPYAVIVYSMQAVFDEPVRRLLAAGVRVVAVGGMTREGMPCPGFLTRPEEAGRQGGERLLRGGAERVAVFGEFGEFRHYSSRRPVSENSRRMIAGIGEAVPAFDPERDSVGDCYGDLSELTRILKRRHYDGWFCANKRLAKQLYLAAVAQGLRVPDDLQIVAGGDRPLPYDFPVDFTTVAVDSANTDGEVVQLIQREEFPESFTRIFDYQLIEGNSTR